MKGMKDKREEPIKNIPQKIYLILGDGFLDGVDFSELHEVTWATDKIYKNDICYVLEREEPIENKALEKFALDIRKRVMHYNDDVLAFKEWFSTFIAGYKANQSDAVAFANWLGQYYGYDGKVWINLCDIKAEEKLTTEELYQIFKNKP